MIRTFIEVKLYGICKKVDEIREIGFGSSFMGPHPRFKGGSASYRGSGLEKIWALEPSSRANWQWHIELRGITGLIEAVRSIQIKLHVIAWNTCVTSGWRLTVWALQLANPHHWTCCQADWLYVWCEFSFYDKDPCSFSEISKDI